jgi:maleamate amidohydrolase
MWDRGVNEMTRAETLIAKWGEHFPVAELSVLAEAGYGHPMGFGSSPALLVVDVTYSFCGATPQPILEAIRDNRRSCGDRAWAAMEPMRAVLGAARSARIPVIFSAMRDPADPAYEPGLWGAKNARGTEDAGPAADASRDNDVVDRLKPLDGELVLSKDKPSIFHGTNLPAYLISRGVDSLIICGGTTSGCVYASSVDGFSHNYKVSVVADATFDRVESPHWASLLDIDMKYGDVVTSKDVIRHLAGTGPSEG